VFDGSSAPGSVVDVVLRDDVIIYVGPEASGRYRADSVIDASGLIVAPGFIDPHTHAGSDLASSNIERRACGNIGDWPSGRDSSPYRPYQGAGTGRLLALIPENSVMTMAEGQILPLIIFAVLFGIILLMDGEEAAPVVKIVDAGAAVMQQMTMIERWHQTLKNRILLENYFLPGDLEAQVEAFVEHYNHQRYHESLQNVTPADAYFGRAEAIINRRERIKRKTIEQRRLHHRKLAA